MSGVHGVTIIVEGNERQAYRLKGRMIDIVLFLVGRIDYITYGTKGNVRVDYADDDLRLSAEDIRERRGDK